MAIEQHDAMLNRFLVDVFHEILRTEELCLAGTYRDLSLKELHLIEEVCRCADKGLDNRATAVAAAQRVTAGTLTSAVSLLEKKGYLERHRDEKDKRVVRILPTEKAREAEQRHIKFHAEMVADVLATVSPDELDIFVRALGGVSTFFHNKYGETL